MTGTPAPSVPPPALLPSRRPRLRDRHGRGVRGPLAPSGLPLSRSRSEQFDDVVLEAVEHLEERWATELAGVEFAVEEVPPPEDTAGPAVAAGGADAVPLARLLAAAAPHPARIVIYRRPVEARAPDRAGLADLVHDIVVEQVAELLGLDPDVVDPPYE